MAPADVTTTDEAEEQCCEKQSIERADAAMVPSDVTTTDEAKEQCCEEQSIERGAHREGRGLVVPLSLEVQGGVDAGDKEKCQD